MHVILEHRNGTQLAFHIVPPHYFSADIIDYQEWQVLLQESMNRHPEKLALAGVQFWVLPEINQLAESAHKKSMDSLREK